MENQFNDIEQIDLYLTNKMSVQDRAAFEKELEVNEALKADVEIQQELRDVVITSSLEDIRSMMKEDFKKQTTDTGKKFKWLALAGLLVITLIGGHFLYQNQEDNSPVQKISYKEVGEANRINRIEKDPTDNIITVKTDQKGKSVPVDLSNDKVSKVKKHPAVEQTVFVEVEDTVEDKKGEEELVAETEVQNLKEEDLKVIEVVLEDYDEKLVDVYPLSFEGKLKAIKSSYQESTGKIIVDGAVKGGEKPYHYFIEEDFPQSSNLFEKLAKGGYQIYAIDNRKDVISLGEISVEESLCVLDYNQSFVPAYDGSWSIPVVSDNDFTFKVYGISGIVYEAYYESNDRPLWLGIDNDEQKLKAGYYRFEIKYSNEEQCLGELTIGN